MRSDARRRLLQTGRTSLRVSLSQTNGLRLFDAVFHRNLLFIIPPARDDIEPCLLVVALMSLIAPPVRTEPPTTGSRRNPETSSSFLPPVPLRAVGARKFNSPFFFFFASSCHSSIIWRRDRVEESERGKVVTIPFSLSLSSTRS